MSIKRVYTVKSARQRFAREAQTTEDGARATIAVLRKDGTPKLGRGGVPMKRRLSASNKERPLPNYKCGKCGVEIAVGTPYRYWEPYFRSSAKSVRCMKSECTPRMSELESSNLAQAYSAQEDAEANLNAMMGQPGETADIHAAVSEFADSLDELASEYRQADENFGGGGSTQSGETADTLESTASDLQSFSVSDEEQEEFCERHSDEGTAAEMDESWTEGDNLDEVREACDECNEKRQDWWNAQVDEALSVVSEAQFS